MRRRFRPALVVAFVAAAIVAPWQVWSMLHVAEITGPLSGSYGSYGAWLSEGARSNGATLFLHTVSLNAREIVELIADRFSLRDSAGVRTATAYLAIIAAGVGAYDLVKKAPVTIAFLAIYLVLLLAWPFTPWRFFFAVWPIVVVLIAQPIVSSIRQWSLQRARIARFAAIGIGVILAAGATRAEARAYRGRTWRQGGATATAQIGPVVSWVRAHTSDGDVVAGEGEQLLYLFAGRQAVPLTSFTASEYMEPRAPAEDAAMALDVVDRYRVRYIVTLAPGVVTVADSLAVASSRRVRLVPIERLGGGAAAYRVESP
jgi:hypothetical protein